MPNVGQLIQALMDGVANGSNYAIIALAFSLLWATMRTLNMALIQTVMVGGIFAYYGASHGILPAILFGVGAAAVVGTGTHYISVESTVKKGLIYPIIASLGLGALIQGVASLTFGDNLRPAPEVLPAGGVEVGPAFVGWDSIVTTSMVALLLIAVSCIMKWTSLGLAFRAASWSPDLAQAYGVNVSLVRFASASAAAIAAGFAGTFAVLTDGSVSPTLGAGIALTGLVAMLIGGAGNLVGSVFGGLLVGLIEAMSGLFVSGSISHAISFLMLFLVMVVKPSGLMKER